MPNMHRGDVAFDIDGRRRVMRLTLGGLAELEESFGEDGLAALGRRLSDGRLSARDICEVLAAGLRGAGEPCSAEDVGLSIPAGRFAEAAEAAARLLAVTFGGGNRSRPPPPQAA